MSEIMDRLDVLLDEDVELVEVNTQMEVATLFAPNSPWPYRVVLSSGFLPASYTFSYVWDELAVLHDMIGRLLDR